MENFNEKYERYIGPDGKTRFRYPIPGKLPSWMSGMEDALRRAAGEPTSRFMTPDEINKVRQSRGETPYTRAEFETFGVDPASLQRRVPLQGYDEPASPGKIDITKYHDSQPPIAKDQPLPKGEVAKELPKKEEPKVEKPTPEPTPTPEPRPEPTLSQQYQAARAAKDFSKADELGKRIWAKKYSTPDGKSKFKAKGVDISTGIQNKMFKAIRDDKLDQAVFKRAQRIGATMEAYDVVLDYLLSEGHAETVEEAHYVMMQMDAEYIQSIVEKFPDVKGTLNPWESPTTGKSGVKYVTDPKTGKPVQIRNPLYKGV